MWNLNIIREALLKEETHYRIKVLFHVFYIVFFILIQYLPYAIHGIRIRFPDFFFRDAFEYSLVTVFAYAVYLAKEKYNIKAKIPAIIVSSSIILGTFIVLAYFKNLNHVPPKTSFSRIFDDFLQYVGFFSLLTLLFIFIDSLEYFLTDKFKKIEETLVESKTMLLRQQLQPHFLLNALNSIFSMSISKNPDTSNAILKFSNIMRYLTDEANIRLIPIEREINFLKEYISIEKIRFGESAKIDFEIAGNISEVWIEPLLFVTLAENAFKHGFTTNNKLAFVSIYLEVTDSSLLFNVKNWIPPQTEKRNERKGKGLANLNKRLQLSYPKKHQLKITQKKNQFDALLILNRD